MRGLIAHAELAALLSTAVFAEPEWYKALTTVDSTKRSYFLSLGAIEAGHWAISRISECGRWKMIRICEWSLVEGIFRLMTFYVPSFPDYGFLRPCFGKFQGSHDQYVTLSCLTRGLKAMNGGNSEVFPKSRRWFLLNSALHLARHWQ